MESTELASRVAGIAALAEPIRRDLYLFVAAQQTPVSRDEASAGLGVARHTAKFHLDKLVAEGLLEVEYKRPSDRRGPGAGRPTKRYRRSQHQLAVTLPERQYELAARVLASAIDRSRQGGVPIEDSLHEAAAAFGARLGGRSDASSVAPRDADETLTAACEVLAGAGYEPHRDGNVITLTNCPFDALAHDYTQLVCGINLDLLTGVADSLQPARLCARLAPQPGRCCVVLSPPEDQPAT